MQRRADFDNGSILHQYEESTRLLETGCPEVGVRLIAAAAGGHPQRKGLWFMPVYWFMCLTLLPRILSSPSQFEAEDLDSILSLPSAAYLGGQLASAS